VSSPERGIAKRRSEGKMRWGDECYEARAALCGEPKKIPWMSRSNAPAGPGSNFAIFSAKLLPLTPFFDQILGFTRTFRAIGSIMPLGSLWYSGTLDRTTKSAGESILAPFFNQVDNTDRSQAGGKS
jgi:hypothetical protein